MKSNAMLVGAIALALSASLNGAAVAQSAGDDPDLQMRKSIEDKLKKFGTDEKALKKLRTEGRDRTVLCKTCHGPEGISNKPNTPNLAGQNPVYIVDQFQRFGDGRRNDFFMSSLAKSFSEEDKLKVALYYSNLAPGAAGNGRADLQKKGEVVFTANCVECHGADGKGQEGYARLAGQQPDYVFKMLKEFRDRTGKRFNPWMSAVAVRLTDDDMEAVAAYLANLK